MHSLNPLAKIAKSSAGTVRALSNPSEAAPHACALPAGVHTLFQLRKELGGKTPAASTTGFYDGRGPQGGTTIGGPQGAP